MTPQLNEINFPFDRIADESKDLIVHLSNTESPIAGPVYVFIKYPHNQATLGFSVYQATSDGENIWGFITNEEYYALIDYIRQCAVAKIAEEMADETNPL